MVLLLNLLVPFFLFCVALVAWKTRNWKWLLIVPVVWVVYKAVQPSYIPKGDIKRTEIPAFERSDAEIVDNARKPIPSNLRNAEQERQYREGLSFIGK